MAGERYERCKWCGKWIIFVDAELAILHEAPPCQAFAKFIGAFGEGVSTTPTPVFKQVPADDPDHGSN